MALTLGTNAGFVTVAPTADPSDGLSNFDTEAKALKDTSPATAIKITEIGWFCENATEETNFEVGIYAADGGSGAAGTLLFSDITNAKGTDAGWKTVTVDWAISSSTTYWIAIQIDNTATATEVGSSSVSTSARDNKAASTLPDPFNSGAFTADQAYSIYALVEQPEGGQEGPYVY